MTSKAPQVDLRGLRVLVVEDNYVLAESMRWALESLGGVVVGPAPNSGQAFELLDASTVDAAILDIDLQGRSSAPIADRLRASGVPFLFLTGYEGATLLPQHLHNAICLSKPVDPDELARVLLELVQGASGEDPRS